MTNNKFLFYGPKGCGKSMFTQAFSGEMKKLVPSSISVNINNSHILENPIKNITKAFSEIERFKIKGVVIENFDVLLKALNNNKAGEVLLIEKIQNISSNQFFIATARNPENITPEILTEFGNFYPFYYPNSTDRLDIFKLYALHKNKLQFDDKVNYREISEKTALFSGEDIKNIVMYLQNNYSTSIIAVENILEAINFIRNSISEKTREEKIIKIVDFSINNCPNEITKNELISYSKKIKKGSSIGWNDIIDLKPNFYGVGVNLNNLISKLARK